MKTFIMCAGQSKRWFYDRPKPKPIETILGEPNYKRTIRLLNENGINDIAISVSDNNEHYFDYPNKIIGSDKREIDRFRNLRGHIDNETLVLYGDVVYHENDIETILDNLSGEITFFGNANICYPARLELFGVYITNKNNFFEAVDNIALKFENKLIDREIGLDVFNELGKNINDIIVLKNTEDYDVADDYFKIKEKYESNTDYNA